uniref:Uncharacterized protein n=1 Tax=Panagrolaimus sp. JU765 TaxID=591449 RepID=A0AC34QEN8_9BILA
MDSVSQVVNSVAGSSTTKRIKDLDKQDLKICGQTKQENFDKTCLKSNPFAVFFSKLLNDITETSLQHFDDETSLKILEFQREFKDFGSKNLPLIKRLMYVIYQKKLDQERYQ